MIEPAPMENSKILIIDDNQSNVILLERILHIHGYKDTKTLTDSRLALITYQQFKPDLVLLDLSMPYMDGYEVLSQIKDQSKESYLPVMMITAQSDQESRLKALGLGAQDFIAKPFEQREVLARIKSFLEIRMLQNKITHDNHLLEEKITQRTKELGDMQIELINRLLHAAEFRDHETGNHILRIGMYAYDLAKLAGYTEDFANKLFHASKMHDIGKIGVPDDILLKPGPLSKEEWAKMKTHTTNGAEILAGSNSPVMNMAEIIALTHHEKWDGSGYPGGLYGLDIPMEGRITALCDVFDALVHDRPYKKAWPLEKALEEIKNGSGTHFDPDLVQIFIKYFSRFEETYHRYSEQMSEK